MINPDHWLSVRQQCGLLHLHRSRLYYKAQGKDEKALEHQVATLYQSYPMYGYRRMTAYLRREGVLINKKRTLRVMQQVGLQGIYPKPKTTMVDKAHRK